MKTAPAATVIALLVASNVVTAYMALRREPEIRADHLQRIRLNTEGDGAILITLGRSETPSGLVADNPRRAATLELTPRAAIQLQTQLTQTISLIHRAAQAQREEGRSQQRVE